MASRVRAIADSPTRVAALRVKAKTMRAVPWRMRYGKSGRAFPTWTGGMRRLLQRSDGLCDTCHMARGPKSPQRKKALSYARDRRNAYGGNDKAARKAIPARKAGENRRARRKAGHALAGIARLDAPVADMVESALRHDLERVGGWTKAADMPLGDHVANRKTRTDRHLVGRGFPVPRRRPGPSLGASGQAREPLERRCNWAPAFAGVRLFLRRQGALDTDPKCRSTRG